MSPRAVDRPGRAGAAALAVALATTLALTACSGSPAGPARTRTPSTASTAATPAAAAPSAAPTTFARTCDDALPLDAVDQAFGQPVIGSTSFVVGVPEPDIGRVAYLNCRYGLADAVPGQPDPTPQVEIGVSLYSSPAQATTRAQGTVDDYRTHGATPASVSVGSTPATVLTGYGDPTLVVVDGARTVAVTAVAGLVTDPAVLVRAAALALTNVS